MAHENLRALSVHAQEVTVLVQYELRSGHPPECAVIQFVSDEFLNVVNIVVLSVKGRSRPQTHKVPRRRRQRQAIQ
jgi:hypothetical protein